MLRQEKEATTAKLRVLQTKYDELEALLEPAREERDRLAVELEAVRLQKQMAEQEARGWERRVNDLLENYQRIDPAEHEALKNERDAAVEARRELEQSTEKLNADNKALHEKLTATEAQGTCDACSRICR
jgi:chromosome segregation ATPase